MTNLEFNYKKYLNSLPDVNNVLYKSTIVRYQDGFTGEYFKYSPTFTIIYNNGTIEYVEVLIASEQMPLTKYLYAQNNLQNWRIISKEELQAIGEKDCETPKWW